MVKYMPDTSSSELSEDLQKLFQDYRDRRKDFRTVSQLQSILVSQAVLASLHRSLGSLLLRATTLH
jgi:hypothetical protein